MRITQKNAQELLPLLHALAEGKQIQRRYLDVSQQPQHCYKWDDVDAVGVDVPLDRYRIKPTEPTLRPWKPEEVPVGALIKNKMMDVRELPATILNVIVNYHNIGDAIITDKPAHKSAYNHYFVSDLVTYHGGRYEDQMVYSLDHGKTWHPCGVVE